ncbi:MAG: type III pantothenate kinase [Burkholderiales bacterium]|nr:type III pantothenate kinase [Burkholderiales bacterium]
MGILLIDLGNTALKWSTLDNPCEPRTFVHESSGVLDINLRREWLDMGVTEVYGCSVGSEWLTHSVSTFFKDQGIPFKWCKSESNFNGNFHIKNDYEHPHLLGADRWYASVGAVFLHPHQPLLVCHMGTASTVDSVIPVGKEDYEFLGGRIAPGPAMMREGLARGTSHLPRAFGAPMEFPTNTIAAISTGIVDSQLGLIERAVRAMERKGYTPKILLAGGSAMVLEEFIREEFEGVDVRHNLVLQGLAVRVEKDKK